MLLRIQVKELNDTISTDNDNENGDMLSHDDEHDANAKRILELETQVTFLNAKLWQAKVDIRKSAMVSAIELPALKVQVETREDELEDADEIKQENETL